MENEKKQNGESIVIEDGVSLANIDFNGMSASDIIYIITNNKVSGQIIENPNINYILELAKDNVELAKACLINSLKNKNYDLVWILCNFFNFILEKEPNFEVEGEDILTFDFKLYVIQKYLNMGKYDFVVKNLSIVYPTAFLNPYIFDNKKTILDALLDNNIDLSNECYEVLLRDPKAVLSLFYHEEYLSKILNDSEGYYAGLFLETLSSVNYGIELARFFYNNFDRFKSNPHMLKLAKVVDNVALVYTSNGLFKPLVEQPFRTLFGNYTVLGQALSRFNRGDKIDVGIEYFDNLLLKLSESNHYYLHKCIEVYIEHKRIEPLKVLSSMQLMQRINDRYILEYVLDIDPNFELKIEEVYGLFKEDVILIYARVNNITILEKYKNLIAPSYGNCGVLKRLLDENIELSNNIVEYLLTNDEAVKLFVNYGKFLNRIIQLPAEFLLLVYYDPPENNGKTVFEVILEKEPSMLNIGRELSKNNLSLAKCMCRYDPQFLLEVDENTAREVTQKMSSIELAIKLKSSGVITELINKYGISFCNYIPLEILDGYVSLIEEKVKQNPYMLGKLSAVVLKKIGSLAFEIIANNPSIIIDINRYFLDGNIDKIYKIAGNNLDVAKNLIKRRKFKVLQFLPKESLIQILPYTYEMYPDFNGIPYLAYSDSDILEIVRKYRADVIDNQVAQKICELKSWCNTELLVKIQEYFGDLITVESLSILNQYIFLEEQSMYDRVSSRGYYSLDSRSTHILVSNESIDEKSTIVHETIHKIFARILSEEKVTGFNYGDRYIGFNETVTEFFCQEIMGDEYVKPEVCGYYNAVLCLRELFSKNIPGLDIESFKRAYVTNNVENIRRVIDSIGGEGYFENKFAISFNIATKSSEKDVRILQRLIVELVNMYEVKNMALGHSSQLNGVSK